MRFLRAKPKTVAQTVPIENPERSKKLSDVEQFTQRIQDEPEEADKAHKDLYDIDKWIYLIPGPSIVQQDLVREIHTLSDCYAKLRGYAEEKLEVILRVGINDNDPNIHPPIYVNLGTKDKLQEVR